VRDYESPFQLPKCNYKSKVSQTDPARWPFLHASEDNCPLHTKDGMNHSWQRWAYYRNMFATVGTDADRQYALNLMLSHVSESNPPDVHAPGIPKARTVTWYDIDGRPHSFEKERKHPSDLMLAAFSFAALALVILTVLITIL
jgi:hypothetical protein